MSFRMAATFPLSPLFAAVRTSFRSCFSPSVVFDLEGDDASASAGMSLDCERAAREVDIANKANKHREKWLLRIQTRLSNIQPECNKLITHLETRGRCA